MFKNFKFTIDILELYLNFVNTIFCFLNKNPAFQRDF